jgi:PAS domain S-box-containing protein
MSGHDAAFLAGVLAAIAHPVYVADRAGRLVLANPALTHLIGRSEAEVLGKTLVDVLGPEDGASVVEGDSDVLASGERTFRDDATVTDAAGVRRAVTLTKVALRDAEGAVSHVVGVLHDITALRAVTDELERTKNDLGARVDARSRELADAQAGLVRKERLAVLGQLAGGMAHQIRNPLGAIKNAAYVLERHVSRQGPDEGPWALSIIHDEVKRANQIITHLLDYARVRAPIPRRVDVIALVEQVVAERAPPPYVEIERRLAQVPLLSVDVDQVHGALSNLVDNAVDAMGETLETGRQRLVLETRHEGDFVVIALEDSGPGVAAEIEEHLFEPLFTTKPLGLGLGLVTARTLIEEQGGTLRLARSSAPGARFEVRLPLRPPTD